MTHIPSSRILHSQALSDAQKETHRQLVTGLNNAQSPALYLANFVRHAATYCPADLEVVAQSHVGAATRRTGGSCDTEGFTQLMEALAPTPLIALAPSSATQAASRWMMHSATFTQHDEDAQKELARLGRLAAALHPHRTHFNALSASIRQKTVDFALVAPPHRMFSLIAAVEPYPSLHKIVQRGQELANPPAPHGKARIGSARKLS